MAVAILQPSVSVPSALQGGGETVAATGQGLDQQPDKVRIRRSQMQDLMISIYQLTDSSFKLALKQFAMIQA
jgi:hypothetical protein